MYDIDHIAYMGHICHMGYIDHRNVVGTMYTKYSSTVQVSISYVRFAENQ